MDSPFRLPVGFQHPLTAAGPWPRPARDRLREAARLHALAHPAWGHRKVWAMCRHDGLPVSAATVLRLLRQERLLPEANYQRERRQLAARRKAAFAVEPTAPNQVWQLDSLTSRPHRAAPGGWPTAGTTWSKYELGWRNSPTANQHDAISAIELALAEAGRLAGRPLLELAPRGPDGTLLPLITILSTTVERSAPSGLRPSSPLTPSSATSRPYPRQVARAERVTGTRVRVAEVRAAVPRGDRRRPRPRRARPALSHRLQHDPPALIWRTFCQVGRVKRCPRPSSWTPLR